MGDFLIIVCVFAEVTKCWLFQPAHDAPCANGGGGYIDEEKRERGARTHTHTHTHTNTPLDIVTKHYVADVSI